MYYDLLHDTLLGAFGCQATTRVVFGVAVDLDPHLYEPFSSVSSQTSTRLRMFSMVFPKTLLFIGLKKCFSKAYFASEEKAFFASDVSVANGTGRGLSNEHVTRMKNVEWDK